MCTVSFTQSLALIRRGQYPWNRDVFVTDETPDILTNAGVPALPLMAAEKHMYKCMSTWNDARHTHEIDIQTLAAMPEAIAHPVMVFDADNRGDSVVVVTDLYDRFGQPIIVSIHMAGSARDFDGRYYDCNFITSVYGKRPEGVAGLFNRARKDGRLLYCNYSKFTAMVNKLGLSVNNLPATGEVNGHSANADSLATNRSAYNAKYANKMNWQDRLV